MFDEDFLNTVTRLWNAAVSHSEIVLGRQHSGEVPDTVEETLIALAEYLEQSV